MSALSKQTIFVADHQGMVGSAMQLGIELRFEGSGVNEKAAVASI
jgi:hypothetical protein